jgi:hypothetical protein
LSADGKWIAATIFGAGDIAVAATSDGHPLLTISKSVEGYSDVTNLDFTNDGDLIVGATIASREKGIQGILQVWSVAKQRQITAITPDHDVGGLLAVSPGRRYAAMARNVDLKPGIEFYDLKTRELVGRLTAVLGDSQIGSKKVALITSAAAFSVDGSRFAAYAQSATEVQHRLAIWNVETGALISIAKIRDEDFADVYNQRGEMQFLPNGQSVSLLRSAVFEATDGHRLWPPQGVPLVDILEWKSGPEKRHPWYYNYPHDPVCAESLVTSPFDGQLLVEKQESIGVVKIQSTATESNTPTARPETLTLAPSTGRNAALVPKSKDLEQRSLKYRRNCYADVVSDNSATIVQQMRWLPGGERPSIGLRWGIGLVMSGPRPTVRPRSEPDAAAFVEPLAKRIRDALQQMSDEGAFGRWPKVDDAQINEVSFLGRASAAELMEVAKRQGLDVVLAIGTEAGPAHPGKARTTTLVISIRDVATGEFFGAADPFFLKHVGANVERRVSKSYLEDSHFIPADSNDLKKESADERSETLLSALLQKIIVDFRLGDMPNLTPDNVRRRLDLLVGPRIEAQKFDDFLPLLAEIEYFRAKNLIRDHEQLQRWLKFCDDRLGPGGGAKVFGTPTQRRELLNEFFSRP